MMKTDFSKGQIPENNGLHSLINGLLAFVILLVSSCADEEVKPVPELGSMTDIEGNTYVTVRIGNQWWMAENLRVQQYRNGDAVEEIIADTIWQQGSPGFSRHPQGSAATGLLYNWRAVTDPRGIAPSGWHVATDDDWKTLEKHLGMSETAAQRTGWRGEKEGDALKANGTQNWVRFDPVWADNSSGFSALAGSCRIIDGRYGDPGVRYTGFWWTSSSDPTDSLKACYRYIDYKSSRIFRQFECSQYGFSIRCVKDN